MPFIMPIGGSVCHVPRGPPPTNRSQLAAAQEAKTMLSSQMANHAIWQSGLICVPRVLNSGYLGFFWLADVGGVVTNHIPNTSLS